MIQQVVLLVPVCVIGKTSWLRLQENLSDSFQKRLFRDGRTQDLWKTTRFFKMKLSHEPVSTQVMMSHTWWPWAAPPGGRTQGGGGGIVRLCTSEWWTLSSVRGRSYSPAPPTEKDELPRNHWPGRSPAWWTSDAQKQTNKVMIQFTCSSGTYFL